MRARERLGRYGEMKIAPGGDAFRAVFCSLMNLLALEPNSVVWASLSFGVPVCKLGTEPLFHGAGGKSWPGKTMPA